MNADQHRSQGCRITTIRFEDHGQDFLEWDIKDKDDGTGVVVACRPFQGFVWVGKVVRDYELGQRPKLRFGRYARVLNYRIVQVSYPGPQESVDKR